MRNFIFCMDHLEESKNAEPVFHISLWKSLGFLYLTSPFFLFFIKFTRIEISIPALCLLAWAWWSTLKRTRFRFGDVRVFLVIILLSALWIFLGGAFEPVGQSGDWTKHYAIMNELVRRRWPVYYEGEALRYYLGWYLPTALLLKIIGIKFIDVVVAAWNFIGLVIAFKLLADKTASWKAVAVQLLVFIFFSGADIVGFWLMDSPHFPPPYHFFFDWWAGWGQISANTTSFFWVPQHAIAAWIAVGMLFDDEGSDWFPKFSGILVTAICFWSPFVAIGFLLILPAVILQKGVKPFLSIENILAVICLALPVALYLSTSSAGFTQGFVWLSPKFSWLSYCLFVVLEFGATGLLLWWFGTKNRLLLAASIISLVILPVYIFGDWNDLLMRGSLPAIAVIASMAGIAVATLPLRRSWPLVLVLLLGVANPASEMVRGFYTARIDGATYDMANFLSRFSIYRKQYLATSKPWILRPEPAARPPG